MEYIRRFMGHLIDLAPKEKSFHTLKSALPLKRSLVPMLEKSVDYTTLIALATLHA